MGGCKPKKSGAKPSRSSTRHAKQHIDLRPHLWPRPRARGLRKHNDSNTSGGVQAGAAAAPKQVDVGLSPGNAADWAAAQLPVQPQSQRVRATLPPPAQTAPR